MPFHLYSSNSQDVLVANLATFLRENPLHPMESESILIQNHGMQRWVNLKLAQINGIVANTAFLFPNDWISSVFRIIFEDFKDFPDRDTIFWLVLEELYRSQGETQIEEINPYLKGASPTRFYSFSRRLAQLFFQYSLYRPDMILNWEKGKFSYDSASWQSQIWFQIQRKHALKTLFHYRKDFFDWILSKEAPLEMFPKRIFLFGISSLPKIHIEILGALTSFIDVHLFFLNPSREYWSDILSRKEALKRNAGLEQINLSLLASFGKNGREFLEILLDQGLVPDSGIDLFQKPGEKTLLEKIKKDIFELSFDQRPRWISRNDKSIQIHACHSEMREVEILHDQILHGLNQDTGLKPDDILVLAPNINDYAPFIKAVFSREVKSHQSIPYSISDRNYSQENGIIYYFHKLLAKTDSRFGANAVLELLECKSILGKFGLLEEDLEWIQHWIKETHIHWGIDAKSKTCFELPHTHDHTWAFGLDRLLTGYAMSGKESALYQNILPYDHIEGSNALILGKFLDFFQTLKALVEPGALCANQNRDLKSWSRYFYFVLEHFFSPEEEDAQEVRFLGVCFQHLGSITEKFQFSEEIPLEMIRRYLIQMIEERQNNRGFLGYGVTFCSSKPMRSIPFKMIAFLGLNDQKFPRIPSRLNFDMMNQYPKFGDPSLKNEDRYMFLESLLCAEKILYLSYVGQSQEDNTSLPPSTLIRELMLYIKSFYSLNEEKNSKESILDCLITKHHLQAYHQDYFMDASSMEKGFSKVQFEAALQNQIAKTGKIQPFLKDFPQIIVQSNDLLPLDLGELLRFYKNPDKFFITQFLGFQLEEYTREEMDIEPFELEPLENYFLQEDLLKSFLHGHEGISNLVKSVQMARGNLPVGKVGDWSFQKTEREMKVFVSEVAKEMRKIKPVVSDFELYFEQENVLLKGKLKNQYENQIIQYRPAKQKLSDCLGVWLEQLICQTSSNQLITSALISKEKDKVKILKTESLCHPKKHLQTLIQYYLRGVQFPLPLFSQMSLDFARSTKLGNEDKALENAETAWDQMTDVYVLKCFGNQSLRETGFHEISKNLLNPFLEKEKE